MSWTHQILWKVQNWLLYNVCCTLQDHETPLYGRSNKLYWPYFREERNCSTYFKMTQKYIILSTQNTSFFKLWRKNTALKWRSFFGARYPDKTATLKLLNAQSGLAPYSSLHFLHNLLQTTDREITVWNVLT